MAEGDVVLTDDLHTAAQVLIQTLQGGLERKRRLWQFREEVTKYRKLLADAEAALAVEENEAREEGQLVRHMFETWRQEVEARAERPNLDGGDR